jgi:hypothetical protein
MCSTPKKSVDGVRIDVPEDAAAAFFSSIRRSGSEQDRRSAGLKAGAGLDPVSSPVFELGMRSAEV